MLNKDDIITYLLDRGGDIEVNEEFGYPVVFFQINSIGYIFHMVDSDMFFSRDTFNTITGEKEREDTFAYDIVEEKGIDEILKYFSEADDDNPYITVKL